MKLTIKLKLFVVDPKHEKLLESTRRVFVDVLNYSSKLVFENNLYNKISFQKKFYYEIKKQFPTLNSQLIIQAIRVCCSSYKNRDTRKKLHVFKKYNAVTYDARLLSYSKDRSIISIATVEGRVKIPLHLNPYFIEKVKHIKGEADLVKRKGNWYLNQVIEVPEKEIKLQVKNLGIDLGLVNIAVDSLGNIYNKEENDNIELHRKRLLRLKSILQKVGSKSSKRHLKKMSGIESRFRKDVNHMISKKIVRRAKDTHSNIKLEDLTGIRERTTVKKNQRAKRSSWSFYQLREFITYKAKIEGVKVILVDPSYTSQECSKCGFIDNKNRKDQEHFECIGCGFKENADKNAAINISRRPEEVATGKYLRLDSTHLIAVGI